MNAANFAPRIEGRFNSFTEWCNKASSWLTGDDRGPAVCIDALGRRCSRGEHFERARDQDAFPVYFFWDCVEESKHAKDRTS